MAPLIDGQPFRLVGRAADTIGVPCYVVGGYVRDLILGRHSKDIDFVAVGRGIDVARQVAKALGRGTHLAVYRNFGTAQVHHGELELEFVGARRESYDRQSRKPIVEDGTLEDDLRRRDFTINAMAVKVNADGFGEMIDLFGGVSDLHQGLIRTPLDPDVTFSDDPLRMMRAIRFATQLGFTIVPETFEAIRRNAQRLEIISRERIADELNKIMLSPKPSTGWALLREAGLLTLILPELAAMAGVEVVRGRAHKDNFWHTLKVLDNVAAVSDNLWLRWAALLHDIGKPRTKRWDNALGWTFHNHNYIGAQMVPDIFRRLKLPLGQPMRYVKKMVDLHMRPIALVEDIVTDSAVRRLSNYAEDDLHDLMTLARADVTSRNEARKEQHLRNFDLVDEKLRHVSDLDRERARRSIIRGDEIMHIFGLPQCPTVGLFTKGLLDAQREALIEPTREAALAFIYDLAARHGIAPVNPPFDTEEAPEG